MGILKSTANLAANAKYKFKRFLSASYSSSIVRDVPAPGGTALAEALWYPPNLKRCANISSNSLMLAVEHVTDGGTRDYSVISTEGGSFKVVQHNRPNFSLLLRDEDYCPVYGRSNYDILASCNKWMLLKCNRVLYGGPYELLWNPTTDEVRPLPFFDWPPRLLRDFRSLKLYWNCHGIGFDPASEDYKVLRCGLWEDPCGQVQMQDKAHAALFSLKTGSWKGIPYPHFRDMSLVQCSCVHINGISYWIGDAPDPARLGATIVSFDFTHENFLDLIPLPESDKLVDLSCLRIVEFRGSLAAVVSKYKQKMRGELVVKEPIDFEIWVWNDGWSLDSTYNVPLVDDYDDDYFCVERVIGLYKNDKALLMGSNDSLLLYDCHTRVLKDLGIHDERGINIRVYPYVQST